MTKRIFSCFLVSVILFNFLLNVEAFQRNYFSIKILDDTGEAKFYNVILEERDLMFSGEDLAAISGFSYYIDENWAIFKRGKKEFKININENTYTLGNNLGTYLFESKIINESDKYYFSGAEVLPWLNVNCKVKDGEFWINSDFISYWEIEDVFLAKSEEILFDFEQCCKELGVNSKWLKVSSYICDMGIEDVLWVPFTSHTLGSEMDYIEIMEKMIKDEARVEDSLNQIVKKAGKIDKMFSVYDDFEKDLPEDIDGVAAFFQGLSMLENVTEIVLYYELLNVNEKNCLKWIEMISLNSGAYEYPDALLAASLKVANMYEGNAEGISEKLIYTLTDDLFDYYIDVTQKEGFVKCTLDILGMADALMPDWREGINQISDYNTLAQCGIEVFQNTGDSTHIYNIELKRSHAIFYAYCMEQNWKTMADLAADKGKYELQQKYLNKGKTALSLQGQLLATAKATVNDSHEYDDGNCKEGYKAKLRTMFTSVTLHDKLVEGEGVKMNPEELEEYLYRHEAIFRTWVYCMSGMDSFTEMELSEMSAYSIHFLIFTLCQLEGNFYTPITPETFRELLSKYTYVTEYDEEELLDAINEESYFAMCYNEEENLIYYEDLSQGLHIETASQYEFLENGNLLIHFQMLHDDLSVYAEFSFEFVLEDIPKLKKYKQII